MHYQSEIVNVTGFFRGCKFRNDTFSSALAVIVLLYMVRKDIDLRITGGESVIWFRRRAHVFYKLG